MEAQPINLNRDDLGAFIKAPRTIRAFENLNLNQDTLVQVVTDVQEAPVIGVTLSDVFDNDRALAGSSDILLTDGGPKADLGIELTTTGVTASSYGDASHFVQFAVDDKGRITLAAQYVANTDNVTEGATNLYFTVARARNSLSGSATVTYNSGTGVFSLTNANVVAALGFTPQPVDAYLTAISGTVPAADGTYLAPTSITIANGIITAIS